MKNLFYDFVAVGRDGQLLLCFGHAGAKSFAREASISLLLLLGLPLALPSVDFEVSWLCRGVLRQRRHLRRRIAASVPFGIADQRFGPDHCASGQKSTGQDPRAVV